MALSNQTPVLVERHGQWIAITPRAVKIRLGVTADSREAALDTYREAASEWEALEPSHGDTTHVLISTP